MANLSEKIRQEAEADATEAWKPDHNLAIQCFKIEEMLRKGMQIFRGIREQDESWSRKVQDGTSGFDEARARHFRARYEAWYAPCDQVLDFIDFCEKNYRVIEGSNEFTRARLLVRELLAMKIDDVVRSMQLVAAGEYEEIYPGRGRRRDVSGRSSQRNSRQIWFAAAVRQGQRKISCLKRLERPVKIRTWRGTADCIRSVTRSRSKLLVLCQPEIRLRSRKAHCHYRAY